MQKTLSLALLAASTVSLLAIPMPATAFHGAPYMALGTAVDGLSGTTYDAVVKWSGVQNWNLQTGTYQIEIYHPATGEVFLKQTIPGRETFTNLHFVTEDGCPSVEVVDYRGESLVDYVLNPLPDQPSVLFEIEGWQRNNLCTGQALMHYWGHFLTNYELDLVVWTY